MVLGAARAIGQNGFDKFGNHRLREEEEEPNVKCETSLGSAEALGEPQVLGKGLSWIPILQNRFKKLPNAWDRNGVTSLSFSTAKFQLIMNRLKSTVKAKGQNILAVTSTHFEPGEISEWQNDMIQQHMLQEKCFALILQ